jgi:hypothetical protein
MAVNPKEHMTVRPKEDESPETNSQSTYSGSGITVDYQSSRWFLSR